MSDPGDPGVKAIDLSGPERLFALRLQQGMSQALTRHEEARGGLEAASARCRDAESVLRAIDAERAAFVDAVLEDRGSPDVPEGVAALASIPGGESLRLVWGLTPEQLAQGHVDTRTESPTGGPGGGKAGGGTDESPEPCTCSHDASGDRVPKGPCPEHPEPGEPGGPMLGDAAALELARARLAREAQTDREAEAAHPRAGHIA